LSFLTPCRCALAVFREEARKALQGIKKASVTVQVLQCPPIMLLLFLASAVPNRQIWQRRGVVPVKPTALEQNRTRQSPAALNTTENNKTNTAVFPES
jgi:hypothetical protein